jgi:hypothetical protein
VQHGADSETAQLRREIAHREIRDDDRHAIQARLEQMDRFEQAQQQGDAALDPAGQRMLVRDVGQKLLQDYGAYIPLERREILRQEAIHFQDEAAFRSRLSEQLRVYNPELPEAEREAFAETVAGYTEPSKDIYLNNDQKGKYYVLMHEAIHRVSAGELRNYMGRGMDEGLTHYFARQEVPGMVRDIEPVFDPTTHRLLRLEDRTPRFYEDEAELVEMLAARVGDAPLKQAKFGGDLRSLQDAVDRELGPGSFDALCTQARRLEAAKDDREWQRIYGEVRSMLRGG